MVKKIIVGIVIFITVGVVGGISCLNYKIDNSVEKENVLNVASLQDKIDNTLEQEVNEIKEDSNDLKKNIDTTINENNDTINKKENEQVKSEKVNTTKSNVTKNNIKENKNTKENVIMSKDKETQKQDNNKKEEIPKKEEPKKEDNKTKEPIYNQTETNRMIASIDKFAKQNSDLIGKNGEKLYNIRISKDAMRFNCFYPFRESQIEAKVSNVFSCTFVVYAVDVNGVTKYYIGIE